MSDALVSLLQVEKTFINKNEQVKVLRGVSLMLFPQESLSITGPSGAGKSTLLHIIAGLYRPSNGQVRYEGRSAQEFSEKEMAVFRNKKVGFIFQFYHLIEELSVLENVMLPAMISRELPATEIRRRAGRLLESLEMRHRVDFYPSQLSGGEKQRAAIARALMNKPALLLCDEPTGNLDAAAADRITALLLRLHKSEGVTLVVVTHNEDLAKKTDRIIRIKDGIITT